MVLHRKFHVGKEEIVFLVAVGGLILLTVGSVFFKRSADSALVTAFVGLLGLPIFFSSSRKGADDE